LCIPFLQVAVLKRENECLRTKNGVILPPEQWESFQASLSGKSAQLQEMECALAAAQAAAEADAAAAAVAAADLSVLRGAKAAGKW
jgi:hypothetical protein